MKTIIKTILCTLFLSFVFFTSTAQNPNLLLAEELLKQKDFKNAKTEIDKVGKDADSATELKNNWVRVRIYYGLLKAYSLNKNIDFKEFESQLQNVYQLLKKAKNKTGFNLELINTAQVHINVTYNYIQANQLNEAKQLLKMADTIYSWHTYDKSPKSTYLMNAVDHYFVFYKSWIYFKTIDYENAEKTIALVSFSDFLKKDTEYYDYLIELYSKTKTEKLSFVLYECIVIYHSNKIKYYKQYFDHATKIGYSRSSSFKSVQINAIKNFPDSIILYEKIANCYKGLDFIDMDYSIDLDKYFDFLYIATQKFPNHNGFKYQRMITFMNISQVQFNGLQNNPNDQELKEAFTIRISKAKEYYNLLKSDNNFLKSLNPQEKEIFNSLEKNLNN
ncbi:MAG: hypothetical protein Q8K70_12640 [Bacteroidota bacterium]|nr:hypothetical protein [Bacteroidota bacterium]